ncbi:MAG: hypothetical protein LRY56_11420 [Burkholderiaceae bacterium]|nr:hypothetical protein [Burkholderiaceae bacterium]MCD8538045.1 hypothetical protein [Burkholderiaceae bacterium]
MLVSSAQFVFQALRHPLKVGAVLPSSNRLGLAMARTLFEALGDELPIVELGPGTGQITKHLPKTNLTLVEINHRFSKLLARAYPDATVFTGSAVEFFSQSTAPCAVVSSIPLLNNPEAGEVRQTMARAYEKGLIKNLITYSYGSHSPFAGCGFAVERQVRFVALNLPPARVWLYA